MDFAFYTSCMVLLRSPLATNSLRDFFEKVKELHEVRMTRKFQDIEEELWCLVSQSEKRANHREY